MTDATVAPNVFETLHITCDNSLQVTLDVIVRVNLVAKLLELLLGEVFDTCGWFDLGALGLVASVLRTDTKNVGQTYLNLFFGRNYDVSYSRHNLTLPLFVLGFLFVDDVKSALAAD